MTGFQLKLLAMLTMLIDHAGMVLFPELTWMRVVGRLAFPLYCFLLAEGAVHTRNIKRYLCRLLAFAVLSEIPYDLACSRVWFDPWGQNVFFTLFFGLLACAALQWFQEKPALVLLLVGVLILAAELLFFDYGGFGVALVMAFYLCRANRVGGALAFTALNTGFSLLNGMCLQLAAPAAAIPMLLYNRKKGKAVNKWIFYGFYPGHLLLLFFLRAVV
ncbi:TraX family protein [Clostridium sp. D33t1_170424_F3]|uniref:TraX family protein n=1 Tax=Clostridium sp. D33t1_170424_F3 TaxID=2787099 RepID=UPI0018A88DA3|nr:TraX family protein [Clostridium sp. D33t1_170424_F3]